MEKRMLKIVVHLNLVASRPPERWLTGTLTLVQLWVTWTLLSQDHFSWACSWYSQHISSLALPLGLGLHEDTPDPLLLALSTKLGSHCSCSYMRENTLLLYLCCRVSNLGGQRGTHWYGYYPPPTRERPPPLMPPPPPIMIGSPAHLPKKKLCAYINDITPSNFVTNHT